MIETKEDLKRYLELEKPLYIKSQKAYLKGLITRTEDVYLWKLVKTIRYAEYYFNNRKRSPYYALMNVVYSRKKASICMKLGIEISSPVFQEGLRIFHPVGIVINGDAKIGKNCMLHGANVVGNMGNDLKLPVIGDEVRFGVGARVLGDVYIADRVQIGAGALVLESCYEEGALLVGVPAKIYHKEEAQE